MLGRLVTLCGSRYPSRAWRGTDAVLALGRADASTQTPAATTRQRYCILCTFAPETCTQRLAGEVPVGASRLCTLHVAHCTLQSPNLPCPRLIKCHPSAGARCEMRKRGGDRQTATKVHAQVISGAEWCDRLARRPLARLLLFSSCSQIFSLSALWIWNGRPGSWPTMSAFVQLLPLDPGLSTFSPSLHRPPSHRDSGRKREDAHDDGDGKKKKSELTCSRRQQPRQHGAENEEETIPARHMPR
jgi:hypothetical protein